MKKYLFVSMLSLMIAGMVNAGEKIKVLVTYCSHHFEQEPFFAMFDAMNEIEYTKVDLEKEPDMMKPGLEEKYDVIFRFDMVKTQTPEQQQAFVDLMNKGIGLVSIHHNFAAHKLDKWDEYKNIIGGKYIREPEEIEGQVFTGKTPASGGEEINIMIVDKDHEITKGLKDFKIRDETFGDFYVSSKVKVLIKTDHPKNDPCIAWVNNYGNSRVFYCMLGHDDKAWSNPEYRELLQRGIKWAAGK